MALQQLARFSRPRTQRPAAPAPHLGRRVFTTPTFPATQLAYRIELYLGGSWIDVTSYVYVRNPIRIGSRGRPDGAIQSQPATLSFTADNRDGRWCATYALGAWYGLLRKGVKVRAVIDHGAGLIERLTGAIAALPPRWDVSENDRYVLVTAAGTLRRLGRGQVAKSAIQRTMLATLPAPVALFPLEDRAGSGTFASAVSPGLVADIRDGSVSPSTATGLGGSAGVVACTTPVPGLASQPTRGNILFPFPLHTLTGTEVLTLWTQGTPWVSRPTGGVQVTVAHRASFAPGGGLGYADIQLVGYDSTGGYTSVVGYWIQFYDSTGLFIAELYTGTSHPTWTPFDGLWHEVQLSVVQSGADIAASVYVDGAVGASVTMAGRTLTAMGFLVAGSTGYYQDNLNNYLTPYSASYSIGQVSLHTAVAGSFYTAGLGYLGEQAHVRYARLCAEDGVDATTAATVSQAMGAQPVATLPALLAECADADAGASFDGRSGSLVFQSVGERYSLPVALALDHDLGHVAPDFQPTDDDQRIVNDFTAHRSNGSSAQVVDSTGPNGTDPDIGAGRFDDSATYNVASDSQLPDQAGWRVRLGTVEGLRVPQLSLNLARNPDLIDAWLACDIGSRVTLANPPPGMPTDLVDVIIEGYSETFGGDKLWRVDLNCSPYEPYRVAVVAADVGDADPFLGHLDWDSCVLQGSLTTTATSATLTTDPAMTEDADDYPFDGMIGGEQVTVTAVVGYLNANPYFETPLNASSWTAQNGATIVASSAQFHQGAASLLITPDGTSFAPQALSEEMPATALRSYTLSGWLRSASSGTRKLGLFWYDASHTFISANEISQVLAPGVWTQYGPTAFTAPLSTVYMRIASNDPGAPLASNTWRLDEITVTNPGTQVFTITRSVNGVAKAHNAGDVVTLHPNSACWLGL